MGDFDCCVPREGTGPHVHDEYSMFGIRIHGQPDAMLIEMRGDPARLIAILQKKAKDVGGQVIRRHVVVGYGATEVVPRLVGE